MWTLLAAAGTVLLVLTSPGYVGAQEDSGSQKSQAEQLVERSTRFSALIPAYGLITRRASYWMGLSSRVRRRHP
jgi:hypothetical protein